MRRGDRATPWTLRRATGDDARAMAAMHVRAWRAAYRGIVPDAHLDGLDPEARAARYRLEPSGPGDPETWLAVDGAGGDVIGFVTTGPCRDADLPGAGEVWSIYVDPGRWRGGVGTALMADAVARLERAGFREAVLWVLTDNARARRFYETSGWHPDGATKTVPIGGQPTGETRYRRTLGGAARPLSSPVMPGHAPDPLVIQTERLSLVSMSLAFMRALAAGDLAEASRLMDAELPDDMAEDLADFLGYRIPDLERDPSWQPWLGRSMVWTHEDGRREVIGTIGFHAPPDDEGRVEIGYRVEPAWRRRGIATECVRALLAWAEEQGVHRFRASVAPDNAASLAVIGAFGFRQVGEQMDEIDGLELVFHLDRPGSGGA